MDHQGEDHEAVLISQMYPGLYNQVIPQQGIGEGKGRRRRKKSKGEGGMKKRKLSKEQVHLLEKNFGNEHKLESERKDRLALELGLDPRQVAVWFQNRRARWKTKKLEEEYLNLKKLHDSVVVDNCLLQTQILKLKEQLSEAEKEKQRLMMTERADEPGPGPMSNSPSPSLSMDAVDPTRLGDFGVMDLGYEDVFYMPENSCIFDMDWANPYI